MKRFSTRKAVAGAAIAAGLLIGAATARADEARYTVKGATGAGVMRVRPERQQVVAGFRVETDAQGRQMMSAHPTTKGATGAGGG